MIYIYISTFSPTWLWHKYLLLILGVIKSLIKFFQQCNLQVLEDVVDCCDFQNCKTNHLQKYSHLVPFPIAA